MMSSPLAKSIFSLLLSTFSYAAFADQQVVQLPYGTLSGNVGIVTKYIYRGGIENNDMAAQGGLEYSHNSGIRVGYWGSTLDYNPAQAHKAKGFEHNFYLAYAQQLNPDWGYRVQTMAYVYHDANKKIADNGDKRDITTYDVAASLNYKNFSLNTAMIVADSSTANQGDTYFSAAYSQPLAQDFSLNASVGGTAYNRSHDDEVVTTQKDFAFNEARLGLGKRFDQTGLVASLDYVFGGKDRMGADFEDHMVFGLNYQF